MATQTILFYLHSIEPAQLSYTEFDENNHVIQTCLRINDLSTPIPNEAKKIIVVVPALEILLTYAQLPKLARKRLRQAIPFSIEEQLIEDITELHFSIGEYQPENYWPVTVVSRQKMSRWIELLDQLNIYPNKIVPITLALPFTENRWTVYCLDNQCFIRTGTYTGFSCDPANLSLYLESKINEETIKPAQIDIYSEEKIPVSLSSHHSVIHSKVSEKKLIETLGYALKTQPSINLLQGPFRTKRKSIEAKKFWTYAAYVTLAWIGIGLINNLFSLLVLHYRESTINHQITAIYQRNFPGADTRIPPKQRMEDKLKKMTAQASNESFLVLLANIGKAYSQSSGTRLQTLDYRDKQFTMEISAGSFDELDSFTQALQQNALNVKQQHAEMISGRVKAALQISGEL